MFTTGKAHFGVGAGIPLDWFWRARMVAAVERGGSRTGGRSAQGDGSVGTIASKMGGAERSNFTNWPKASLPCCQQVRKTLAKICCVRAPVAVRLPPQVLRAIAMSRIARSAKLLVACNPGQRKKVNRGGCAGAFVTTMQSGAAQKGEQVRLLMAQVVGQPLIVRAAKMPIQHAIQLGLQPPGGHRQAMCGQASCLMAIAQAESLLQQCLNRQGELGGCRGGHLDHLATAPDQVLQAALMKRPFKSIETSRSVMHQKTGVVLSQNRRRLGIPTMRFNHVNGDLFAQQHPQILRPCAYSPAGVVQPYHGALPQLTLQLLVGGRRQIPQSRQGPAYPTPAPLQPVAQFQHPRRARVRQPQFFIERSEEHTSELQSLRHLVCRLLLEKKKLSVNGATEGVLDSSVSPTERPRETGTARRGGPKRGGCWEGARGSSVVFFLFFLKTRAPPGSTLFPLAAFLGT